MTSVVQTFYGSFHAPGSGAFTESFPSAPTGSHKLYAWLWGGAADNVTTLGWSLIERGEGGADGFLSLWEADASAGQTVSVSANVNQARALHLYETDGQLDVYDFVQGNAPGGGSGTITGPTLTATDDNGVMLFAVQGANQSYVGTAAFTPVSPLTEDTTEVKYSRGHKWSARRTTALVAVTPSVTVTGLSGNYPTIAAAAIIAIPTPTIPVADFTADGTTGVIPLTVTFTDLSTNTPTSWLWDFGDGSTSTSQNPSHAYTVAGTYSVTLTATNAFGSDSETKSTYVNAMADVGYTPPEPAGVLLEIYAADPGAARWDVAKWDEDSWGSSGWQDVTPYGVTVDIDWGSNRPELGILSTPDAASWAVDYFDPERILDPANAEGPYFGDLLPFLPIRVSHRSTVIRQGYATGIAHSFAKNGLYGYMRGADNITLLANAKVPSDTALSDTLYARAVDAISAAGLSVTVATPIGTDPPVSPWVTGEREWSAWEWIKDAAQEVLHIPIVDRLGTVTFRPWASPLLRGKVLGSPELLDLTDVVDYSGNYSVVQAREDDTTVIERALTPSPRYGARTYTRDEVTLDPGDWADAVLADRGLPSLLWKPGEMRPLTALSTESLALIEAVELVTIEYPEADPAITVNGIVVGGSIHIEGKRGDAAIWRFEYALAQTAAQPLTLDGGTPTDYLTTESGSEYLYPDGSA